MSFISLRARQIYLFGMSDDCNFFRRWPPQTIEWYLTGARDVNGWGLTGRDPLQGVSKHGETGQRWRRTDDISILIFVLDIAEGAEIGFLQGHGTCHQGQSK